MRRSPISSPPCGRCRPGRPATRGDRHRRLPLLRLLAALIGLFAAAARAGGLDQSAFGPPTLDGVETGLRDGGRLPPYVFLGGHDWPAIRLHAPAPLDWSAAGALAIEVDNPTAAPFALLIRLDDRADADGDDRSLTGLATIAPQTHVTVLLPFGAPAPGMRGQPPSGIVPHPGEIVMGDVRGSVDRRHIVALHVSGVRTATDRVLRIGPPSLRDGAGPAAAGPLADAFGQAIAGDWPEKVANDTDLRARLAAAAQQTRRLAADMPASADRWGGVPGTAVAATGAFRVAKSNGRWMFVTPAGHALFSLGVDAVQATNPTLVEGRAPLFSDLPAPGTPLARFVGAADGRRTVDVGEADLARGLGPDWARLWPAAVLRRLGAWGFNTLGNWSDAALAPAMPHVVFHDVEGPSAMVPMGGRALRDPFDPRFAGVADAVAQAMTAGHRDDAGLIGYFSGNELPWGETGRPDEGIAAHVLALGPDSPARQALLDGLRARYATPGALAAAWEIPTPTDWGAIAWPRRPTAAARADLAAFEARFADLYFSTVAAAIHRHDPRHLYLGTRFAAVTPEVVRACARWCDVLSFNVYGATPAAAAAAWRGLDRPVLIGEFHFGSLDRGSFWPGMVAVPGEADRGPAYAAYLDAAVADPQIVGCHWYQYADEPLTGRPYDGENGHIGLVTVADVPYAGFVAAVAASNRRTTAAFARQVATISR